MKFNFFKLLLFLALSSNSFYVHADGYEDYDIEEEADAPEDIPRLDPICNEARETSACDVLNSIINTLSSPPLNIDFLNILKLNLLLRTNRIQKRNVDTLPIFTWYHNLKSDYCKVFAFHLFYNQTTMQTFNKNCKAIKGYINVEDEDLLDELAKLDRSGLSPIDVPNVIDLFKNARLEERRAGIMFQYLKNNNKHTFEFKIPLFYQERNFNFTERERENIQESDLFSTGVPSNPDDAQATEKMIRKYAAADLLGIGDLDIRWDYLFVNQPCKKLRAGIEILIPTAVAFKKGLIGSDYSNSCNRPSLDVYKLVDQFSSSNNEKKMCAIDTAKELSFELAERFGALMLQTQLGENRHFRLGVVFEPEVVASKMMKLNSYLNLSYIFPKTECRYFLRRKDCNLFRKSRFETFDPCDEAASKRNLDFIGQQIINTFFPDCVRASVDPRFMAQFNFVSTIDYKEWQIKPGLDFWYYGKENVYPACSDASKYYIERAQTPAVYQMKVFGKVSRLFQKRNYDFELSLNGDYTFLANNIGKDFSAALEFKFNF